MGNANQGGSPSVPGQVSIGVAKVAETVAAIERLGRDWLTDSERGRLGTITGPRRYGQFLAGRWALRKLLAAEHGGDPEHDWGLLAEPMRPPRLATPPSRPLYVSLSHSGDMLACGVAPYRVGVDIEVVTRSRPIARLLDATLSQRDRRRIESTANADLAAEFYTSWALKEAWIKQSAAAGPSGTPPYASLDTGRASARRPGNGWVWTRRDFTVALVASSESVVRYCPAFPMGVDLGAPVSWWVNPSDDAASVCANHAHGPRTAYT